jgi:hypothetical protein
VLTPAGFMHNQMKQNYIISSTHFESEVECLYMTLQYQYTSCIWVVKHTLMYFYTTDVTKIDAHMSTIMKRFALFSLKVRKNIVCTLIVFFDCNKYIFAFED